MDGDLRDARRRLAGATARRDVAAQQDPVVRAAAVRWPQLGRSCSSGSPRRPVALVAQLVAVLAAREGEGDDVLVRQLCGELTVSGADIEDLVSARVGDGGGWLDRRNGQVTPDEVADALGLDVDADHLLHVPGEGSGAGWQDRMSFAQSLPPGRVRDVLVGSLEGRGAFRRFSDELDRHEHLVAALLGWRDDRAFGRARRWLADAGLLDRRS